jgi:hypothetical protein
VDIPQTEIITLIGLFESLFMSFGLMNAAQSFPQLMDHLYCHLPLVFTYFDDYLIANRTTEEHLEHFKSFFSVLHENRLTINTAKLVLSSSWDTWFVSPA